MSRRRLFDESSASCWRLADHLRERPDPGHPCLAPPQAGGTAMVCHAFE
ncbi:hypothetical protein ACFSHR_11615 [Azotobacter chroococcum]